MAPTAKATNGFLIIELPPISQPNKSSISEKTQHPGDRRVRTNDSVRQPESTLKADPRQEKISGETGLYQHGISGHMIHMHDANPKYSLQQKLHTQLRH